jgi:hypothetical protein
MPMKVSHLVLSVALSMALLAPAIAAPPAGPSAEYVFHDDADHTIKSPDGATTIEQYARTDKEGNYLWQFWARRADTMTLLGPEQQDYAADFRFTRDSRWIVRLQKTGSGEGTMYLYKLGPKGFEAATSKPFGDLVWAYFYSRPESRKVKKPNFHVNAGLIKGIADNFRELTGETWPDSRYLVVAIAGEIEPTRKHRQMSTVGGWRCRYDLQTGKFDVPAVFAKDNAEALEPE